MANTRRLVTEEEKAAILKDVDSNMPKNEIGVKYGRHQSVIYNVINNRRPKKKTKKDIAIVLTNKALEQANSSPLMVGSVSLIDLLSKEQTEVEEVYINIKTRKVTAIIRRTVEFSV